MRTDTRIEYQDRVEAAVKFVLGRLDNPPSPIEIADHAGFSRFHFGRIFSLAVGESLAEFVRRLRLERAAWQLQNTDELVTDTAFEAGYESLEGFSRAFREEYLVSPSEFRQRRSQYRLQRPCGVHWCPDGMHSTPVLVLNRELHMEANIKMIDDISVVALRHVGPYNQIGQSYMKLVPWLMQHQISFTNGLGIFHDLPDAVPPHELRSDACVTVGADVKLPVEAENMNIRNDKVKGGEYAVAIYYGPYDGLGDAWARFGGQAVPKLGREIDWSVPAFEMHMNDCTKVAPEELRTDLYVKLK